MSNMSKEEFVRGFVDNDMQFEDFDAEHLELFRQELIALGFMTHAEELTAEKFSQIRVTIDDLYINMMEDEDMNQTNKSAVEAAVEEMMGKFVAAKENIKINVGETKDEYIDKVDDSIDVMKGALGTTLNVLDDVLGYSVLKDSILDVLETGQTETSKKDLFRMAKRCRELIELEIENLEYWGDEESLLKAIQLKPLVEGERGKSIFEAFATGIVWIVKKVARKLRKWFNVDEEKTLFKNIIRGIGEFAKVIGAGVKIVWNATKFAVSFVIAGAIKFGNFIVGVVKSIVEKIKGWFAAKSEKFTNKDVTEDKEDDVAVTVEVVNA